MSSMSESERTNSAAQQFVTQSDTQTYSHYHQYFYENASVPVQMVNTIPEHCRGNYDSSLTMGRYPVKRIPGIQNIETKNR